VAEAGDPLALGQLLRSRRERLAPGDVGLPAGSRRRTAGLRREEVAQLAGLSITYYTFLEQGRPVRPSPSVLDARAGALRMSDAERRYLRVLTWTGSRRPGRCSAGSGWPPRGTGVTRSSPR
jgi:Helix-turn-helix domain